jgi:hypothetical protein
MNAATLARLRRVANGNMNVTAAVSRLTIVPDGMGGTTESWADAGTLSCRRTSTLSQAEQQIASRLAIVRPWIVQVAALSDVRETDRLVIGSDTLEVVQVGQSSWEAVRRVLCSEVE